MNVTFKNKGKVLKLPTSGFTIIELIGVILLFSIILTIAVPQIFKYVENSKRSTLKSSSQVVAKKILSLYNVGKLENEPKVIFTDEFLECPSDEVDWNDENGSCSYVVYKEDDKLVSYIIIVGKGKFNNLVAYGSESEIKIDKDIDFNEARNKIHFTSTKCFGFDSGTNTITAYYNYEDNDNSKSECPKEVKIPSSIGGVEVSTIGSFAFQNKGLVSVKIPNTVKTMLLSAFAYNKLTSLVIPDGVISIESSVFIGNRLTEVKFPNSLTAIGHGSFRNNFITDLVIPNSVTYMAGSAFENNKLTSVTISSNLTEIQDSVFANNQLTSLTIPNGIKEIQVEAFENNQISSLYVPASVHNIQDKAFYNNQISDLNIFDSSVIIYSYAFAKNQIETVTIPYGMRIIEDYAFSENPFTSITVYGLFSGYSDQLVTRFDSRASIIGWGDATINHVKQTGV